MSTELCREGASHDGVEFLNRRDAEENYRRILLFSARSVPLRCCFAQESEYAPGHDISPEKEIPLADESGAQYGRAGSYAVSAARAIASGAMGMAVTRTPTAR